MDTKRPINGPDTPTSKKAFRSGIGPRFFITAPIVPIRLGNGIKYGNDVMHTMLSRDNVMPCFMGSQYSHNGDSERETLYDTSDGLLIGSAPKV